MGGHDAELGIVLSFNDADLWSTDALIDAGLILIATLETTTAATSSATTGAVPKTTAATDIVLLWTCCGTTRACTGRWGRRWPAGGCATCWGWWCGTSRACALRTTIGPGEVSAVQVIEWIAYG